MGSASKVKNTNKAFGAPYQVKIYYECYDSKLKKDRKATAIVNVSKGARKNFRLANKVWMKVFKGNS